eukprot:scaffold192973_cov34-Tisochrysis_lutea.AAC.3
MEMIFRKLWSLKEAFTKARGDGLGFPFKRCEFTLGGSHPLATARIGALACGAGTDQYGGTGVQTASVAVDGVIQPEWKFYIQPLADDHWVSVARGPPSDAVDAHGGFKSTFKKPNLSPAEIRQGHDAAEPPFVCKRIADLVSEQVAAKLSASY